MSLEAVHHAVDPVRILAHRDVVEDRRVQRAGGFGFLGRHAADADLRQPRVVEAAAHRAGMVVRRAHVAVAQIGVRVDLQHRQPRIPRRRRGDQRRRDRVLAAERDEELVAREDLGGQPLDLLHHRRQLAERELHLRQREQADRMDVGAELLVPQLHVRRRLENFVRAVARAGHVRRGAIERHREDHRLRVVEGAGHRHRAAEGERRAVVVLERKGLGRHLVILPEVIVNQNARPMRPNIAPLCRSSKPSWRHAAPAVSVTGKRVAEHGVDRELDAERQPRLAAAERRAFQAWPASAKTAPCTLRTNTGQRADPALEPPAAASGSRDWPPPRAQPRRSSSKPRTRPIASASKSKPPGCGPLPPSVNSRRTRSSPHESRRPAGAAITPCGGPAR